MAAYAQIVAQCPVPVVAAGGPKAGALEAALAMIAEVVQANARGETIGRNVWGFVPIAGALEAFKAVIHEGWSAQDAVQMAHIASPGGAV